MFKSDKTGVMGRREGWRYQEMARVGLKEKRESFFFLLVEGFNFKCWMACHGRKWYVKKERRKRHIRQRLCLGGLSDSFCLLVDKFHGIPLTSFFYALSHSAQLAPLIHDFYDSSLFHMICMLSSFGLSAFLSSTHPMISWIEFGDENNMEVLGTTSYNKQRQARRNS